MKDRKRLTASNDDFISDLEERIEEEKKYLNKSYRPPIREASVEEFDEDVIPNKSAIEIAKRKIGNLSKLSRRCFSKSELSNEDVKGIRSLVNTYGRQLASLDGAGEIAELGKKMEDLDEFTTDSVYTGSRVAGLARNLIVASEIETKNENVVVANKLVEVASTLIKKKKELSAGQLKKIKKFVAASEKLIEKI